MPVSNTRNDVKLPPITSSEGKSVLFEALKISTQRPKIPGWKTHLKNVRRYRAVGLPSKLSNKEVAVSKMTIVESTHPSEENSKEIDEKVEMEGTKAADKVDQGADIEI